MNSSLTPDPPSLASNFASYGGQVVSELTYFDPASPSQDHTAEDDATMEDTVEKVAERLAQLENTVAEGFHESNARFTALDNKINVSVESLRGDIKTVIEVVNGLTDEMRRTTESIRKESAADREVLKLALLNHERRIHSMEVKSVGRV